MGRVFLGAQTPLSTLSNQGEDIDVYLVMNLPAIAVEFLDVFDDLEKHPNIRNVFIACHCFVHCKPHDNLVAHDEIMKRLEAYPSIRASLNETPQKVRYVRS